MSHKINCIAFELQFHTLLIHTFGFDHFTNLMRGDEGLSDIFVELEFKNILENEQYEPRLQVQYFAKKLNLHPNYLNSVIKNKTGRTVNDWISGRTISLAKSLLLNTSYSSKEISYKLGFSEPTHFSRFFKKHTQVTPSSFRKMNTWYPIFEFGQLSFD